MATLQATVQQRMLDVAGASKVKVEVRPDSSSLYGKHHCVAMDATELVQTLSTSTTHYLTTQVWQALQTFQTAPALSSSKHHAICMGDGLVTLI